MDETQVFERMQGIFARIFDFEEVTLDDDFFSLGGDSLLAEELMNEIEATFSVGLSISTLLGRSTPRDLANAIINWRDVQEGQSCLVSSRPVGFGPPLVSVHGLDGKATFPDVLVANLRSERPVFGLRALGLGRDEAPATTLARLAAAYLAELKSAVPRGPYVLVGQCPAAMIAYEMAQQLRQAGDTVAGLVLLDPYDPGLALPWVQLSGAELLAERLRIAEKLQQLLARRPLKGHQLTSSRHRFVFDLLRLLVGAYPPKPYPGETLLVCTSTSAPTLLNERTGFPTLLPKFESGIVGATHKEPFQLRGADTVALVERFLKRVAPIETGMSRDHSAS